MEESGCPRVAHNHKIASSNLATHTCSTAKSFGDDWLSLKHARKDNSHALALVCFVRGHSGTPTKAMSPGRKIWAFFFCASDQVETGLGSLSEAVGRTPTGSARHRSYCGEPTKGSSPGLMREGRLGAGQYRLKFDAHGLSTAYSAETESTR